MNTTVLPQSPSTETPTAGSAAADAAAAESAGAGRAPKASLVVHDLPEHRDTRPAAPVAVSGALLRALGITIIAGVLVTLLPQALIPDDQWSRVRAISAWTSLGLPFAFYAFAAALWRTRGASRLTTAGLLLGTTAMTVGSVVTALAGERAIPVAVDQWIFAVGFILLQLALIDAMVRGAWAGVLRWVLGVVSSWPLVAVISGTIAGDDAVWWAAFVAIVTGFTLIGGALLVRPQLTAARGSGAARR